MLKLLERLDLPIAEVVQRRYSTKAFDPTKKIKHSDIDSIKDLLRYSASSTNSQPWHFILASTNEGKRRVAVAAAGNFASNQPKILNASHVVVFCSKLEISEDYLLRLLDQEQADGRLTDPAQRELVHSIRCRFVNLHRHDLKDVQHWMEKQVYLNVGSFLLGVSTLGINAVPMEGIDTKALDEEFGLREKGYTSIVAVALGYRSDDDFNAKLPKSRLPLAETLTEV
ncbi:Oxygen-insensitive NAD(P)H nitroreductase [Planctomycetes bacterium CA13]|uniref:Oxygen-insensitive NAD(P)H nitroreductase n=1 Tax=Novipirellula herctigrandis TaxID=2527986 RepID=A0A5C5YUY3_9BACT|nr:Oxygen-insensitive NAD(P)H nitroreductase [Planctomycetes bacterium CA13]